MMHWTVAAPFFDENKIESNRWLDDFVVGEKHSFTKIPCRNSFADRNWHNRLSRNTPISQWLKFWNQSGEAWEITRGGVITVFPQLSTMVGSRKRFSGKSVPLVSYCFNIGFLYSGIKQLLAKSALQEVDKFIVHSRKECETVSSWLNISRNKFEFIPLQRAEIPILESEELDNPFLLSMGSANRDYQTFFEAVARIGIKTIVVAGQHSLKGLIIPPNVEIVSNLTSEQCHRLAQKARLNIVPLIDHVTGAGQVTIVEAMRMSRPVIATLCTGSEDYINHGKTGLLVKPYSVNELVSAITDLWSDESLRISLGKQAGIYAQEYFSDEKAGIKLTKILDEFL